MANKVNGSAQSTEFQSLDHVRPQMAKADLASPAQSISWTDVVRGVLIRHFGSLKAAAIELRIDQSQLTREIETGKLNVARLQSCDPAFAVKFGQSLVEEFQALSSPKARGLQLLRELETRISELRQLLDLVA